MDSLDTHHSDFGTGEKKLGMYSIGFIICCVLTLLSFAAVMSGHFSRPTAILIIFTLASIQFLVQIIFFLRLTTQTEQGRTNVMTLIFTAVILVSILAGSLWIMASLNYNMMH